MQNRLSSRMLSKNLNIKIYRNIILPVVLYGCDTWLLTLREERKLGVFENMVLRRIFGPRRDELTVEWRRLHNEVGTEILRNTYLAYRIRGTSVKRAKLAFPRFVTARFLVL